MNCKRPSTPSSFGDFATEYVLVQNREELAEFGGGGAFEIVLSALLVGSTAGVGLAARGVAAAEKLQHLKRLSEVLKAHGDHLKSQRIQRDGKAKGQKTEAQTVKVERPKEVKLEPATNGSEDGKKYVGKPKVREVFPGEYPGNK